MAANPLKCFTLHSAMFSSKLCCSALDLTTGVKNGLDPSRPSSSSSFSTCLGSPPCSRQGSVHQTTRSKTHPSLSSFFRGPSVAASFSTCLNPRCCRNWSRHNFGPTVVKLSPWTLQSKSFSGCLKTHADNLRRTNPLDPTASEHSPHQPSSQDLCGDSAPAGH